MFEIIDNDIYLTRGDTLYLDFNNNQYNPREGDTLTFAVKKRIKDEDYVIFKTVGHNEVVSLFPSDTADLAYGNYVYDVQINTSLGEVFTIICEKKFELLKEVNTTR